MENSYRNSVAIPQGQRTRRSARLKKRSSPESSAPAPSSAQEPDPSSDFPPTPQPTQANVTPVGPKRYKRAAGCVGKKTRTDSNVSQTEAPPTPTHPDSTPASDGEKEETKQEREPKKRRRRLAQRGTAGRRQWTRDEDSAMRQLVRRYGIKRWTYVANRLKEDRGLRGITGKQCRERYVSF
jgi:hypothetical protein